MSAWDTYQNRIAALGGTKRNAALIREQRTLLNRTRDSLSFQTVIVNGEPHRASIINSDNLNEKTMLSLPGEDFYCGSLVEWADNHWLISEKDANNEVYTKVKILQCNYLLHWVDEENIIHEQWCVIEDGTKYLTGEYEDRNFIVTRGDSRISMTIAKNADTAKFGREHRFIIDDPDSGDKLAYLLTKPLKVGKTFNGSGIYAFVLQEVVSTENDNMELSIADYYKHFPRITQTNPDIVPEDTSKDNLFINSGKKVWL